MTRSTKQTVAVELFYDGAWHDLVATDDVFTDPAIVISHGGGEEGAAPKPNRVTLAIANDDDKYRPSNPMSPLWGKVGRNTPCRVSVGGTVRVIGEASFSPDQTADFRVSPRRGARWVDVDAAGLLQRIGQWTEPLKSPFRQFNENVTDVGYWPGEQPRGTTEMISTTIGTSPGDFNADFSPDSQQRPPGSAPLIDLGDNGEVGGYFAPNGSPTSTLGWQLSWAAHYGTLDPAGGDQDVFDWATTDGTQYGLYLNPNGNMNLSSSLNGVTVLNWTTSTGGYDFTQWTLFSVDAQYSGGNTTVWINWCNADLTKSGFTNATFVGVPASLRWWDLSRFAGVPSGSTFGHVIGTLGSSVTAADNLFGVSRQKAWNGYVGELAAARFGRLNDLKGVPYYVSANWPKSAPMGAQPVATLSEHYEEIAKTDDALIFDDNTTNRLFMMCRADRVNQTPTLTLDASNPVHLSVPPTEVLNDLDPHNIVTASQRDGGDYTLSDDTSPMSTLDPPNGIGEYRQTIDVNLANESAQLPQIASWWLAKGTVDLPRFPTVTVDLVAAPALVPAVEATDTGKVIEIVNFREYTIRLHVLGWMERVGTHTRTVTFTCNLDTIYKTGVLDTGKAQAVNTIIGASINETATTIVLTNANPFEQWKPGVSGTHVMVEGEEIILGTIGAPTGTGTVSWTVTGCTRSVNGVVKTHAFAEYVRVKDALRYGLGTS